MVRLLTVLVCLGDTGKLEKREWIFEGRKEPIIPMGVLNTSDNDESSGLETSSANVLGFKSTRINLLDLLRMTLG